MYNKHSKSAFKKENLLPLFFTGKSKAFQVLQTYMYVSTQFNFFFFLPEEYIIGKLRKGNNLCYCLDVAFNTLIPTGAAS